ncbi:hypothetical protein G6F57_018605 [Rhizopus arrhizus]|nr:hypothetical protein G6F57_018605 [Rhizopus arrhizus]
MLADALYAWFHYLAIFVMVVVLTAEAVLLRPDLTAAGVKRLVIYDRLRRVLYEQPLVPRQDHAFRHHRALFDPAHAGRAALGKAVAPAAGLRTRLARDQAGAALGHDRIAPVHFPAFVRGPDGAAHQRVNAGPGQPLARRIIRLQSGKTRARPPERSSSVWSPPSAAMPAPSIASRRAMPASLTENRPPGITLTCSCPRASGQRVAAPFASARKPMQSCAASSEGWAGAPWAAR